MSQAQDRSLDLFTCSPARYHCAQLPQEREREREILYDFPHHPIGYFCRFSLLRLFPTVGIEMAIGPSILTPIFLVLDCAFPGDSLHSFTSDFHFVPHYDPHDMNVRNPPVSSIISFNRSSGIPYMMLNLTCIALKVQFVSSKTKGLNCVYVTPNL